MEDQDKKAQDLSEKQVTKLKKEIKILERKLEEKKSKLPSEEPEQVEEKGYFASMYDSVANSVSNYFSEFDVSKKYEKLKQTIDELEMEIDKYKNIRTYFFTGALIGTTLGLGFGFYLSGHFAKRGGQKRSVLLIPITTLGTGLSCGAIAICIPMINSCPENSRYVQINHHDQEWVWKQKCKTLNLVHSQQNDEESIMKRSIILTPNEDSSSIKTKI